MSWELVPPTIPDVDSLDAAPDTLLDTPQDALIRKDANEVLVKDGPQALRQCIEMAEPLPIRGLFRWISHSCIAPALHVHARCLYLECLTAVHLTVHLSTLKAMASHFGKICMRLFVQCSNEEPSWLMWHFCFALVGHATLCLYPVHHGQCYMDSSVMQ